MVESGFVLCRKLRLVRATADGDATISLACELGILVHLWGIQGC